MPNRWMVAGPFTILISVSSPIYAANGFKAMAKELSRAAQSSGIARVAVLPFAPADGSGPKGGWNIAEKLITQVVRIGRVQAIERSLLRNLMEEHHLAQTGMIDPTMIKRLGKVFSADGIVTGSFVTLGPELVVNARLIHAETGVIIAAVERQVDRDWFDPFKPTADWRASLASPWVPVPEFTVEAPPFPGDGQTGLRDSVADDSCVNAAQRVDSFNKQILDLKARYWALWLKNGLAISSLRHNPGSEITDPLLKKEFYDRMKAWYAQEDIPALTPYEVKRFVHLDSKAFGLYRQCGV